MANNNVGIVIVGAAVLGGLAAYYFSRQKAGALTLSGSPFQVNDCVFVNPDRTNGYLVDAIGYDSSKLFPWYFLLSNGGVYYSDQLTTAAPGLCTGQTVAQPPQQTRPMFAKGDCVQYAAYAPGLPPQIVEDTVLDEAWTGFAWEYTLTGGTIQPESNLMKC